MAWRNLGRNKLRTVLAALGIIIGVVSICSLGMATAALQQQASAQLSSIGDEVTITSGIDSDTDGVTNDQVETIQQLITDAEVVPQRTNRTTLTARNGQEARVSVTGLTDAAALYNLTSRDAPNRLVAGALLTNTTATQLGLELGDPVEYNNQLYRIQGLIAQEGPTFGFQRGQLVLPVSGLSDETDYDSVTIVAADSGDATQIAAQLDTYFNTADEEKLSINSFGNAGQVGGFLDTLSLALLAIGGISLVVAGIAILNVMLMSTVERRGEIGVLRAVGIRRAEVLRMILTEATLMGALGGLIGVLISLAVGLGIFQMITGDPLAALNWRSTQYLVYGFAFAIFASVLSGLYPAWKAANDRPVEALSE